jgi:cell division protein FtsN
MSDDQSFYEIQLNTPHLVLAFLGAAVIGVAIFWLGVVIGRGQSGPAGSPDSEWQAAVPGEQAMNESAGEEDQPLEVYEPVNEAAQEAATGEPAVEETVAEEPPPTQPESTAATTEFQPADPVDEPRDPVVEDSSTGRPMPDPSLVSGWIVQVRSTPDRNSADTLQAALAVDGFPAFVVSAEVDGETWYRVRVGRYTSQEDAQTIEAELLARADVETTWVTEG